MAAPPRKVCSCGTSVLFPAGTTKRTCWNCGVSLQCGRLEMPLSHQADQSGRSRPQTPAQISTHLKPQNSAPQSPEVPQHRADFTLHTSRQSQQLGRRNHGELQTSTQSSTTQRPPPALPPTQTIRAKHASHLSSQSSTPQRTPPALLPHQTIRRPHFLDEAEKNAAEADRNATKAAGQPLLEFRPHAAPVTATCRSCGNSGFDFLTTKPCSCSFGQQAKSSERCTASLSRSDTLSSPAEYRRADPHEDDDLHIGKGTIWLLLVASVVLNVVFLAWPTHQTSSAPSSPPPILKESRNIVNFGQTDTDGDGIPDHHDFCPGSKGSQSTGWMSGRATDFDADGCADGLEDKDKDNDGIPDSQDSCPFTPQRYGFVSNPASDFDHDGCADGREDSDDDNDTIPNSVDACPLTGLGDSSDSTGCSKIQRDAPVTTTAAPSTEHTESTDSSDPSSSEAAEEPKTVVEEYTAWVGSASIEVVLGAVLSAVLGKVMMMMQSQKDHVPPSPGEGRAPDRSESHSSGRSTTGSSWSLSEERVRRHIVRIIFYLGIVVWMRYNGCLISPGMCVHNSFPKMATWLTRMKNQTASSRTDIIF